MICFPEGYLTGYRPSRASEHAVRRDDPLITKVSDAAGRYGIDILAGFMERSSCGMYITHGIFRPDGSADFYRKTHLGESEKRYFSAGSELPVFPLSCGLTAGVALCVEIHQPMIAHALSLKGAGVIFYPHSVPGEPRTRKRIWETLLPARGYDARVYAAAVNETGSGQRMGGACAASPDGRSIFFGSSVRDRIYTFSVDTGLLSALRDPSSVMGKRYFPQDLREEMITFSHGKN